MSARGLQKRPIAWENKTTLSSWHYWCPRTGDGYLCNAQTVWRPSSCVPSRARARQFGLRWHRAYAHGQYQISGRCLPCARTENNTMRLVYATSAQKWVSWVKQVCVISFFYCHPVNNNESVYARAKTRSDAPVAMRFIKIKTYLHL